MKTLKDYLDVFGLLVQKDGDGGDTAHKVGTYGTAAYFAVKHGEKTEAVTGLVGEDHSLWYKAMSRQVVNNGIGVRHPDPTKWWSEVKHFSRDQQSKIVIGSGFQDDKQVVKDLFKQHVKRYGFYQNFAINDKDISGKVTLVKGDVASPEHWGYYFRALNWFPMYPALLVGDLFMLLSSLILIYKSYVYPEDTSDHVMHIDALLQAKERLPTPISWLARKLYKLFLKGSAQEKLDSYFREEAGGPPLYRLYQLFLEKEL